MRYTNKAAIAALIGAALAAGSVSANAGEANSVSCTRVAKEVRAALDSNKTSPNYEAAMTHRNDGLLACNGGYYKMGMEHYAAALKLLGAGEKADSPRT